MLIARANPSDAPALTQIAFNAKRHWGYSEAQMENWRELLTIRPEFIAANETFLSMSDSRVVGFYALVSEKANLRLEHLWVLPEAMGQGVGRSLFAHAVGRTKELRFRSMEIESDPNAEGFYLQPKIRNSTTDDAAFTDLNPRHPRHPWLKSLGDAKPGPAPARIFVSPAR